MNKKISIINFLKGKRTYICSVMLFLVVGGVLLVGCKKNNTSPTPPVTSAGTVLGSELSVVLKPTSATLANDAYLLYNGAVTFQSSPTQQNLTNCRQLWINASADYELSAAALFGPNGSIGADPGSLINTYPIDTAGINKIVSSAATFNLAYIDSLPPYLTGLHGMEFELYGISGTKTATQFSPQQLSYITGVALSIATYTGQVDTLWSSYPFANAGSGSSIYATQTAAFSDLVMAIANITETDGIYKLKGIFLNGSDILQESPFANNSITDIENNLAGVSNIYYGQYNNVKGTGLSAFVSQNNVALDQRIKSDLMAAQKAVGSITVPLSQAIHTQSAQIQLALNACDSLDDDLKVSLLTYMNANTN
ncbi:MAG TPA: imelysin family protein [Bacteroidia bacterium]|nr:imelysin family protein [Bacteroidia bacterium]